MSSIFNVLNLDSTKNWDPRNVQIEGVFVVPFVSLHQSFACNKCPISYFANAAYIVN